MNDRVLPLSESAKTLHVLSGIPFLDPLSKELNALYENQRRRVHREGRWSTMAQAHIAFRLGCILKDYIGWESNIFLPKDSFTVALRDPKQAVFDELLAGTALNKIESDFGVDLEKHFNFTEDIPMLRIVEFLESASANRE